MSPHHDVTHESAPRILLFSQRNIYEQEVWRCSFHEFEGILRHIEAVDVVAPSPRRWYAQGKRLALRLGEHFRTPLNPGIPRVSLDRDYEVFVAICEKPSELLNLNAVKGWKDRCRTSVCWVTEFYVKDMPLFKSSLEVLSQFDHVLFMFSANEPFRALLGGGGRYMPAGIDALRFCPSPRAPRRSIDVLSIGRRSEVTHQALLQLARQEGLFYVHDTINGFHAYDLAQHRSLMAEMAKRSRYFIVNPGKVNAPEETGGLSEFGYRYFEGAAPGAIMIGERPRNGEFDRIFHWPDAVIDLPFGSDHIGAVIKELDAQPERQQRIRRTNVIQSLRHHDWAHRWEAVLTMTGLAPLSGLLRRKDRLEERAALAERQPDDLGSERRILGGTTSQSLGD
jgi:hypothetical protein